MAKKKVIKKPAKKVAKKKIAKKTVAKKAIKKKLVKKAKPATKKSANLPAGKAGKTPVVKKKSVKTLAGKREKRKRIVRKIETQQFDKSVFVAHKTSLQEGSVAPYFEGPDQNGNTIRSSDLLGKNVILYFYPKDHTDGCTAESCSLRDEFHYFNDNNYIIIGVSADTVESHKHFAADYILPFSLVADTDKKIIHAYDVWGPKHLAGNYYHGIVRTTFVIDTDGIIKHIVTKVDSANHAQQLRSL